jgi:hypothetical protein
MKRASGVPAVAAGGHLDPPDAGGDMVQDGPDLGLEAAHACLALETQVTLAVIPREGLDRKHEQSNRD